MWSRIKGAAKKAVKSVGKKIVNIAKKVVKTVVNTIKTVTRTVKNAVKGTAQKVKNIVTHPKQTYESAKKISLEHMEMLCLEEVVLYVLQVKMLRKQERNIIHLSNLMCQIEQRRFDRMLNVNYARLQIEYLHL